MLLIVSCVVWDNESGLKQIISIYNAKYIKNVYFISNIYSENRK